MNKLSALHVCLAVSACLFGIAPAAAQTTLARVTGVYVEVARGVQAERSTTAPDSLPMLAEVRISGK